MRMRILRMTMSHSKIQKLDKVDEDVIRNIIDYVLIYDNEHIEIKWNFDDFHIE